jgi:membrane fusion protein (multidrug efflux system)
MILFFKMKRKYLFFTSLLFFSLIVFLLLFNKKGGLKDNIIQRSSSLNKKRGHLFLIVKNKPRLIKSIKYSNVFNESIEGVYFDVPGELIIGETVLCSGCSFKEDQLLFRLNNKEILTDLIQGKKILYNSISEILPQIEVNYPNEINKWNDFLKSIKPTSLLLVLPSFSSENEKELFDTNGVLKFYKDVMFIEKKMEKYFYLAPYDGVFIKSHIGKSKNIQPGELIASISKNKDLISRFSISKNEFELISKTITFYNESKNVIGKGILKESKENLKTNNIDVCYLIDNTFKSKISLERRVAVEFNSIQNCFTVPVSLIKKDKVKVLDGQKIKFRKIVVLERISNDLIVKGLLNGEKIIL